MASRAEAPLQSHPTLPSDTQGPCGCPGGAFYKKTRVEIRNHASACVTVSRAEYVTNTASTY